MDRRRRTRDTLLIIALIASSGCGALKPRNFRAMANPAPVVRAGAVGRGENQPDAVAIPAWIGRLDDKDPVVRMAAHEELKGRSGQDFGFVPWAEPEQRASAVARWKVWWQSKTVGLGQGGLATPRRKR